MKPKILLVEDEVDLGNVVKQYLEISDFDVDWLLDGKAAFEQLKTLHSKYQSSFNSKQYAHLSKPYFS